jgi:hypothetical protein
MKRGVIIGECLAIVAALMSVATTSATAAGPTIYECGKATKVGKKYTGRYIEKKCTTEATTKEMEEGKTNRYELKEGIRKGRPFKGKGAGANFDVTGIGGMACTKSSDTGKFTSATTAGDVVIMLKDCEFVGKKCESGATAGEVVTDPLAAGFGYLKGKGTKAPKVGFGMVAESGESLATLHCGTDNIAVTGAIIGEVSPVNELTKNLTVTFAQSGLGVQKWKKFEGGPEKTLVTHVCVSCSDPLKEGSTIESAMEMTLINKGEEVMLKA